MHKCRDWQLKRHANETERQKERDTKTGTDRQTYEKYVGIQTERNRETETEIDI